MLDTLLDLDLDLISGSVISISSSSLSPYSKSFITITSLNLSSWLFRDVTLPVPHRLGYPKAHATPSSQKLHHEQAIHRFDSDAATRMIETVTSLKFWSYDDQEDLAHAPTMRCRWCLQLGWVGWRADQFCSLRIVTHSARSSAWWLVHCSSVGYGSIF